MKQTINVVPGRPGNGQAAKAKAAEVKATIRVLPQPGDGITIHVGTDKTPGTIKAVFPTGKRFWYTEDVIQWSGGYPTITRADGSGKQQSAFLYRTPDGKIAGWRKVGEPNTRITIGSRQFEQDIT